MKKVLFLLISILLISCSDADDSYEFEGLIFDKGAFDKNRHLWEENKISSYSFSQVYSSLSVGSQPKLKSIVWNSELDSIFIESKKVNNTSLEEYTYYGTVDDVYHFIEFITNYYDERIKSNQSTLKGVEIDIKYDNSFYYPKEIKCIGHYSEAIFGGLNLQIIFSDFEVK